jgi:decaprenyl-phosphate phosphoribosyltransferase
MILTECVSSIRSQPVQCEPACLSLSAAARCVGKRRGDLAQQNELESRRRPFDQYNLAYLDSMVSALVGATLVVYLLFCVSDYAVARYGSLVVLSTIPVALGLLRYVQLIMVKGQGESPTDLVMGDPGMITIIVVFIMMFTNFIYF